MFNRLKAKMELEQHKREKKKIVEDLFAAVQHGDLEQVTKIVNEHGNDPEVINATKSDKVQRKAKSHGATPLIAAVRRGDAGIVRALLKAACININIVDDELQADKSSYFQHNNALLAAVNGKQLEIVQLLAERADVNINKGALGGETPLICAVENFPAAIPVLLKIKDINLNAKTTELKTALHCACFRRNPLQEVMPDYLIDLLKTPGLDLNAVDAKGWTPLMHAVKRRDYTLVYELMRAGADAGVKNHANNTAAEIAGICCPTSRMQNLLELVKPRTAPESAATYRM